MLMDSANFPLFEAYPRLGERVARLSIGNWPTPVVPVPHFGAAHGLPRLLIKREDLSHPICGGNKVRGLEFLLAAAQASGAKAILTLGAAGSHHVARTAWHAAQIGLATTAVLLRQPMAEYVRRNLLLASAVGANLVPANILSILPRLAALRYFASERPFYIGPGGTTPLSCLGHVNAAFELKCQIDRSALPPPDFIFVPLGSLGTGAGLLLGSRLAGLTARIVGVVTSYRWYATAGRVVHWARRINALMRRVDSSVPAVPLARHDVEVVTSSLGEGYARFTERAARLAESMRQLESIELDGTYTAKALEGASAYIRERDAANRICLFWNTYHRLNIDELPAMPPPTWVARYIREPAQSWDSLIDGHSDPSDYSQ